MTATRRVFLGSALEAGANFAPVFDEGEAGVVIVAETGKGKTQSVLVPGQITYPHSLFFVDFDGQQTKQTVPWRSTFLGQQCHVIDPCGMVPDKYLPTRTIQERNDLDFIGKNLLEVPYRACFNPIDYIARSSSPDLACRTVAKCLFPEGSLKEAHWAKQAQLFGAAFKKFIAVDPLMEFVPEELPEATRSMTTFYKALTLPDWQEVFLRAMSSSDDPFIAGHAMAMHTASEKNLEMQGIKSQMEMGISELFSVPGVLEMMDSTTVDFRTLRDKAQTICVVIPGIHMQALAPLIRLISTIMSTEIEAAGVPEYGGIKHPILCYYDEAWVVGKHQPLLHSLAFQRKFGVRVVLATQNLGQLKEVWGPSFESFMGNVGTIEFFGGTNDPFTAQYISDLCGVGTYPGTSISSPSKPGDFGSESANLFGRPLIMKDEVMRLQMPIAIIKKSGYQMSKCRIINPSLYNFPEFCAFRQAIEEGRSWEQAKRAAMSVHPPEEPPAAAPIPKPVRPRKPSGSRWGLLDTVLAAVMGHETE